MPTERSTRTAGNHDEPQLVETSPSGEIVDSLGPFLSSKPSRFARRRSISWTPPLVTLSTSSELALGRNDTFSIRAALPRSAGPRADPPRAATWRARATSRSTDTEDPLAPRTLRNSVSNSLKQAYVAATRSSVTLVSSTPTIRPPSSRRTSGRSSCAHQPTSLPLASSHRTRRRATRHPSLACLAVHSCLPKGHQRGFRTQCSERQGRARAIGLRDRRRTSLSPPVDGSSVDSRTRSAVARVHGPGRPRVARLRGQELSREGRVTRRDGRRDRGDDPGRSDLPPDASRRRAARSPRARRARDGRAASSRSCVPRASSRRRSSRS